MTDFDWPWEYSFPPFFTIQQHDKTRQLQLSTWADLTLKYHRHNRQCLINVNDDNALFCNETINRKLPIEGKLLILDELQKSGNAMPLDKKRFQWEVYWHPLEEWAELIYKWAIDTGLTNTVCTLFEIVNGENSVDQEFYGLGENVVRKALQILEAKGKCELISMDDAEGVKFF